MVLVASALAAAVAVSGYWFGRPGSSVSVAEEAAARGGLPLALASVLREDTRGGFDVPVVPWPFEFPRDHGAHPQFRSESWYVGALLDDDHGQSVSLQLTVGRLALARASDDARVSAWGVRDLYRAELDVLAGPRATRAERTVRGALDMAGHRANPVRVWVGDWSLEPRGSVKGGDGGWLVKAQADGVHIALEFEPVKPALLPRGGRGEAAAAPFVGYAVTRFDVSGVLNDTNGERSVKGEGWLEHGFGELPLPGGPVVLDRWRLHLSKRRELNISVLRRRGGEARSRVSASLVEANGDVHTLGGQHVEVQPLEYWSKAPGQRRYPVRWRIVTPELDFDVRAIEHDRETKGSLQRWTGPVEIKDNKRDGQVVGRGFVESWGLPAT